MVGDSEPGWEAQHMARVAVVTGGTRGIGHAISIALKGRALGGGDLRR